MQLLTQPAIIYIHCEGHILKSPNLKHIRHIKTFLLSFLFLLRAMPGGAQEFWENYELLTTRQGLPHNIVLSLLQDKEGYLWIGSYNGLCRYDGHSFEMLKDVFGPVQSHNWFHAIETLYEDDNGDIWIGSRGGIVSRFDKARQKFYPCRYDGGANKVEAFYHDSRGRLWVGHSNGMCGIVSGDSIRYLPRLGSQVLGMAETEGRVPVVFTAKDIVCYDSARGWAGHTLKGIPGGGIQEIYAVVEGERNWLLRTDAGYLVVDVTKLTVVSSLKPRPWGRIAFMKSAVAGSGYITAESFVLRMYDSSGNMEREINVSPGVWNANHMVHNCLLQDNSGIVWLGTTAGLYKIDARRYQFNKYARNTEAHLLHDNYVRCLYANGNDLWVGTKEGRINRLVYDARSHTYVLAHAYKLTGLYGIDENCYTINTMTRYGDGILAAGDANIVYMPKGGSEFRVFSQAKHFGSVYGIWSLYTDSAGNVWVGNLEEGLEVRDVAKGKTYSYSYNATTATGRIGAKSVWNIYRDKKNVLWLGTDSGLYSVQNMGDLGALQFKKYPLKAAGGGNVNNVWAITEDSLGCLWIGTTGDGLFRLLPGRDKYVPYGHIPNNVICGIALGRGGDVWVSTVNGLYRHDAATGRFTAYDEQDGLLSNEFNFKAATTTPQGLLFFGNKTGLLGFDPQYIGRRPAIDVPVRISSLSIAGRDTPAAIYATAPVAIAHDKNFINFGFSVPEFSKPLSHRYRYRLAGLDGMWREAGVNQPVASYTNLPPGPYRFVVYGSADGVHWGKTPAVFSFIIKPAFWQTFLFRTGALLGVLLLALGLGYRRVRTVVKREREKHRIEKQIASLELRALQAQMNPHFIFNAINSIQHFVLHNNVMEANDYLSRFSRLMRLFLESSKNRYISLATETELLQLYLQLEQLRFDDKFAFSIDVDTAIDRHKVSISPALIQPFVENAVNHGLVHRKEKGSLLISFAPEGRDKIKCIVDDDGIGRQQAAAINAGQRKNHVSRGMQLIEERIKAFNFIDEQAIEIHIIDKVLPKHGTRVEITLPIIVSAE